MEADDIQKKRNANQVLLEATENLFSDKIEVVKNLVQSSREIFSQEVLDQSVLSCCRKNSLLLLPDIISAGANLEVTDENGNTPLLVCALYNNESCARGLIEAGANVNAFNFDGDTTLIVSVLSIASIGITKLLVGSRDLKIDHTNNKGYTALLNAIEAANFNAIKLLIDACDISGFNEVSYETVLKAKENRNIILSLINLFKLQKATGKSPFLHAALNRDLESAQIMISMDKSIINASNDSLASIMIQFLESIEENNKVVNKTEVQMLEILLTHATGEFISSNEKEIIMKIVVSIGDGELVERLLKFDFIISYKNLSFAVSNPDFLSFLLTKEPDIIKFNCKNKPVYHDSPLHFAMLDVELESAKLLIQHGAILDIDQALEDAVLSDQEIVLQFIISEFPNQVGQKLKDPYLLHEAVINSSLNILPVLLDSGVDINAQHMNKYCLTEAVDVNVLELLLSKGADPNVKIKKIGTRRNTYPIHTFLSTEFEKMLLKKWRNFGIHAMSRSSLSSEIKDFVECLLRHGAQVDLKDDTGRTALHIAASKNYYVTIVQLLIKYGADIDFVNEFTRKPFIFGIKNETILKTLLDNGVSVKPIDGDSPLNSLLAKRHIGTENVKRLIDAGCNVNHVNKDGNTVLINAAWYVDIELLELLVQEGADVNASEWKFPYKTAVTAMLSKLLSDSDRATSCIKYLLDNKATVENFHSRVIHILIASKSLSLIPRFISIGLPPVYLDSEYTFNNFMSPLKMALLLNQSSLARYFININYLLTSDIAVLYGNRGIKILIEQRSALNSKDLLNTVCRNPFSLKTLCLVFISDTLGATVNRRSKVLKLEIPQTLQNSLLFKNATKSVIKDVGEISGLYFNQALEELHFKM